MKLPPNLRLVLIPVGVAIATAGLQHLTDEHDRLSTEIEEHRAELAAAARPGEYADDCTCGGVAGETCPACTPPPQEDFLARVTPAPLETGNPPVRRSKWRTAVLCAAAIGLAAYAARRARRWAVEQAADRAFDTAAADYAAAAFRGEVDPPSAKRCPCGCSGPIFIDLGDAANAQAIPTDPVDNARATVADPVEHVDQGAAADPLQCPACSYPSASSSTNDASTTWSPCGHRVEHQKG